MPPLPDQFAIGGSKDGRCWFAVARRYGHGGQILERWRLDQTGELAGEDIPLAPALPRRVSASARRR